ncbi:Protein LMBR1L [Bienertia sinuspersici]
MPTFSAIQLDRFLEQGASKTTSSATANQKLPDVSASPRLERRNTTSFPIDDPIPSSRRQDIPPPHPQLRRRNSTSSPVRARAQITPSLYATPEPTPIPDSPTSSFPPSSPFLINHKRRGPRLLKSVSDQNVAASVASPLHSRSFSEESVLIEQEVDEKLAVVNGSNDDVSAVEGELEEGLVNGESPMRENGETLMRENGGESEDFYDPQESMSYSGTTDTEDYGGERSAKMYTPMGEFFDAWEELSSDSGLQAPRSLSDVETELRDMRLSLLMEIEKRKQAEEALQSMQRQWQILREKLGAVGLTLPSDLTALVEDSQADAASTEDICRQVQLARFVSESIGRGLAKAEAEAEMETQLEMKNFEIARLCDRLHYYETVNREMSQRNQKAIENARLERQKRKRRQFWVLGSIGAAGITVGTAALIWSYLSSREGSSSSLHCEVPQSDSHVK